MRIIMFGTGPFAVPTFQSLIDSPHHVPALVTRPIQDPGKRRKSAENPTRDVAESCQIPVFDPPSCNASEFVQKLTELQADLFVVCDYGQILSPDCLTAAQLGGINLHGSLLPKYRGAAPINWAIYHGETTTGVTIIHMTPKLDGGPCLVQAAIEIGPTETAEELEPGLATLGVQPVHLAIEELASWDGISPLGIKQDPDLATRAPRLKKSDGMINWSRSAVQIANQIRAFQPWPGSFTSWHSAQLKQPIRLIILAAAVVPDDQPAVHRPGQVSVCDKSRLLIQTGDGLLAIKRIQPAGKRAMSVEEFLRGRRPGIGDQMSQAPK